MISSRTSTAIDRNQSGSQGKFFDITLEPGTDREKAGAEIEQIAHDVLANPVIEECRVEFVE